jgi:hypothetical protein
MTVRLRNATLLLAASWVSFFATPAQAATLLFTGSATATANVSADATCAPLPFRGTIQPINSAGTSNLGNFSYGHVVCTQGATGPVNGTFQIDFADASLTGVLSGTSTARAGTPGLFDQVFSYTINGGTGQFAGATGSFTNVGTVDGRGGPPSRLTLSFAGSINTAAVPEPATWAMMLVGFFGIGGAMRHARRQAKAPEFYA